MAEENQEQVTQTGGDPISIKAGRRNNAEDKRRIREIRQAARVIAGLVDEMEPEDEDDEDMPAMDAEKTLVIHGGAVKALGDGKVGGYLVRYGSPTMTDLTGDYFDAQTDFGTITTTPVLYHHGYDDRIKLRIIGSGTLRADDVGVWVEAQLAMRDEYERAIYQMAEDGKLGWSSGTASHLVETERIGNAYRVKRWPLGLDASLTPSPAEPRNNAVTLKAYINPNPINQEHEEHMTPEELEALMSSVATKAVDTYIKSAPATVTAGSVTVTRDEADKPFASAGEFLAAVKMAAISPRSEDPRLRSMKASGMNETVPSDGGYLVQSTLATTILERMYSTGNILSRVAQDTVGANSNGMTYNAIDETSRVTGSRWGGLQGYWLAEAATKTASKPKFRQLELKLKKVAAVAYATDELLADAQALESWINRTVPEELRFLAEDAIYNGDGAGKPLGIMNSPALVTVTRDTGAAIKAADILNMWSRRWAGVNDYVWLINQDAMPQLPQMTIGNWPVFVPPGGLAGSQYGQMLGAPVIENEYSASLNTTGDIMLASLSQYQTITRGNIEAASSIHVQFLTDETAFRFVYRIDGAPVWNSPLTPFKGSNTQSPFVVLGSAT